jgi:hypothetical protein
MRDRDAGPREQWASASPGPHPYQAHPPRCPALTSAGADGITLGMRVLSKPLVPLTGCSSMGPARGRVNSQANAASASPARGLEYECEGWDPDVVHIERIER